MIVGHTKNASDHFSSDLKREHGHKNIHVIEELINVHSVSDSVSIHKSKKLTFWTGMDTRVNFIQKSERKLKLITFFCLSHEITGNQSWSTEKK